MDFVVLDSSHSLISSCINISYFYHFSTFSDCFSLFIILQTWMCETQSKSVCSHNTVPLRSYLSLSFGKNPSCMMTIIVTTVYHVMLTKSTSCLFMLYLNLCLNRRLLDRTNLKTRFFMETAGTKRTSGYARIEAL